MECHKCEHRAAIEAGKYHRVAWADTPCAKCPVLMDPPPFAGGVIVSDAQNDLPDEQQAPVPDQVDDLDGGGQYDLVSRLVPFVARLLSLGPVTRDVVCYRLAGKSYREIADILGVSVARVEQRQCRAMREWPELASFFASKVQRERHETRDLFK